MRQPMVRFKQILKAGLGALCCSLALNGFAQTTRIDSNYVNPHYELRMKEFSAQPIPKNAVVFLGNSITARGKWAELLPGVPVANRGIGGDITHGVLARLDDILATKPRKIFLLIGINDLSRRIPEAIILQNYERLVRRVKQQSPKTKLYVQSVLPLLDDMLKPDYLKNLNPAVTSLNTQLQAFAKKHKLTYINLHPIFADASGQLKKEYSLDGIHVTDAAYPVWVQYLKEKKYL
ncbi:GDSL-type esterase/lipase family protein [Rufibacter quisquiliarum]|uniref:Lysophospholipase L1-like esterase n=1 Tax=Rufibacter quisquiliarum TaxID=1549639 RepID=A0A839GQ34_9BACT|nr:GDSL-type esterase/lipase family protein [Rufibacter quisquiliarum]MBA9078899.1 lysophospholipase L1-like esterase [Rufibacter quisquiliarum]